MKVLSLLRRKNAQCRIALKKTLQNHCSSLIRQLPPNNGLHARTAGLIKEKCPFLESAEDSSPAKGSIWRSKQVFLTKCLFFPKIYLKKSLRLLIHALLLAVTKQILFNNSTLFLMPSFSKGCVFALSSDLFPINGHLMQWLSIQNKRKHWATSLCGSRTFSLGPSGCGLTLYNHKEVIARFTCNTDLVGVFAGIWFEWKKGVYTPDWWICPSPQQWLLEKMLQLRVYINLSWNRK